VNDSFPDFTGGFAEPYLAYYDYPSPESVGRAHALIEEALETDGPFDGMLGFSQGAGLAMSYLLHQRINSPHIPSEFKFGIFFSTSSLQSSDPEYKRTEIMALLEALNEEHTLAFHDLIMSPTTTQKDFVDAPLTKALPPSQQKLMFQLGWSLNVAWQTRDGSKITDEVEVLDQFRENTVSRELFPRFYHAVYTSERLGIPTVHSWGRNDSEALKGSAALGLELCSDGHAVCVPHAGRHEIPAKREEVVAVANAIEKAAFFGQQQCVVAV
jgi:hypothetical protein